MHYESILTHFPKKYRVKRQTIRTELKSFPFCECLKFLPTRISVTDQLIAAGRSEVEAEDKARTDEFERYWVYLYFKEMSLKHLLFYYIAMCKETRGRKCNVYRLFIRLFIHFVTSYGFENIKKYEILLEG